MQTKLNSLSRTALVLLIATLTSGIMVSTAVSAHTQPLFAQSELIA
jgi:hypothetical protein